MREVFAVKKVPTLSWSSSNPFNVKPKFLTLFYLIIGLMLFGLSEALLITSGGGVSPWTVLAQGISLNSSWSIGLVTFVISLLILVLWVPLKQKPGIGTILNAIIIALMIDFASPHLPHPEQIHWQIVQAIVAILICGLASAIYLTANLGPGPRDGLMTGVQRVTDKPIANVRIALEITVVLIGWYLGGVVGVGTLLFAFGVGPSVAVGILFVRRYL